MLQLGIRGLGIARFKFSPLSWFSKGEQGAWYDPSDLTTLFQDSAGTTPMSAVGTVADQPVGLMLDKSKGLVLGAELVANGGPFINTTGWFGAGYPGIGTITAINGEILFSCVDAANLFSYGFSVLPNTVYTIKWAVRRGTMSQLKYSIVDVTNTFNIVPSTLYSEGLNTVTFKTPATCTNAYFAPLRDSGASGTMYLISASIKQIAGNHAFQATAGNRPLLSARVNLLLATATLSTQSVTTVATNYTLTFTGAGTVTLSGTATGVLSAGSNSFTATAGALTLTVSGSVTLADLRPTNSGALLPPYQRVNTATNYDTVGFPLYLKCNGSSSAMSTNSIDFTATDKMTVVTGVRKLGSTLAMLCETSSDASTYNGSFFIAAPRNASDYSVLVRGTTIFTETTVSGYAAPITNVLSNLVNITSPSNAIKINGVQIANNTGSLGGGVYGNYPLYLFARAGTSFFLNGNFYGAIIRGAQSDTNSVVQTENYMAKQTGITF